MKQMWSEEEISSQKKDIATLVDSKGNPRFIEGEGTPLSQEGFTATYCKWSLSGTHLMLVLVGTIESGITLANNASLANYSFPNWIIEKIYPIWADTRIETKNILLYKDDWTNQQVNITLTKNSNRVIGLNITSGDLTLTAKRSFRVQFDLLIDSK